MHLNGIELRNWGPFKGVHHLGLQPQAYAVVARFQGDPEKSNWGGKSMLLEAVDFALFGRLNKDRGFGADGWVTDGETEGGVRLTFSDGTVVERSRKKTTKLSFNYKNLAATGEPAQSGILEWLGLSADDFVATCYFRQRQMARLVLTPPGERMDVVAAWLRLGPLERAEEKLAAATADLITKAATVRHRADILETSIVTNLCGAEDLDGLRAGIKRVEKELARAKAAHAVADTALRAEQKRADTEAKNARYHELVTEGKALRARLDKVNVVRLREDLAETKALHGKVFSEYSNALRHKDTSLQVAEGKFDGTCPVAGIKCPATAQINARSAENAARHKEDRAAVEHLRVQMGIVAKDLQACEAATQEHERLTERLDGLRALAAEMLEDLDDQPEPDPGAHEAARLAHIAVVDVAARLHSLQGSVETVARLITQRDEALKEHADLLAQVATHREAKVIFGPSGAQRRVAVGALSRIESDANAMLRDAGIDLAVEMRWSREGAGPAKTCDACGNPYPPSAKVKECLRCGTARGPLLVNRLDIPMTDQSGGAEDLAGATLQLAAARWLRADRGSEWSVALIDEPTAALDAANRRAFTSHLAGMLRGQAGFSQALVVSHHASMTDAFPGRIEIVAEARGRSTVRVVA